MKIVQCSKRHFYDKDKYDECPLCKEKKIIYENSISCSNCSTENPSTYKYCYNCGNMLTHRVYVENRKIDVYICVIHHRLKNEFQYQSDDDTAFIAYCGKIYLNSLDCYDENNHISIRINKNTSHLIINYNMDYKELVFEFNQLIKYDVMQYDTIESWDIILSDSEIDFREYLKEYKAINGNLYEKNTPKQKTLTFG